MILVLGVCCSHHVKLVVKIFNGPHHGDLLIRVFYLYLEFVFHLGLHVASNHGHLATFIIISYLDQARLEPNVLIHLRTNFVGLLDVSVSCLVLPQQNTLSCCFSADRKSTRLNSSHSSVSRMPSSA